MVEAAASSGTPSIEGPGKGKPFFDRAKTVADSGNFDYAIDMYIEGLNREPTNIPEHEALRRVAMERKVRGGKAAGGFFGVKTPRKGKTPKDLMLNAEWLLAKDVSNIQHMLAFLRAARDGGYADVIRWFGPILRTANKSKPKKEIAIGLKDMYRSIQDFTAAMDCLQDAIDMDPDDLDLLQEYKDLGAEATMKRGNFGAADTFKESLNDSEKTKDLLQEDALAKTREFRLKQVEQARLEYEAAPLDHRTIAKYSTALRGMEEESFEALATEVLTKAFAQTKTYQYKKSIDEIKMRQFNRALAPLKERVRFAPDDAAAKDRLRAHQLEQLQFELVALHDWSEHYPTDMGITYQYGLRLYLAKRYDDAIQTFQRAQTNPKHRVEALYYLGLSFDQQKMLPESAETLQRAVSEYELAESGTEVSKRLYYALARVYEQINRKTEAMNIYSKITQWDINYRDARQRLAALRAQS